MFKIISTWRNHRVLVSGIAVVLVLAVLSMLQINRASRTPTHGRYQPALQEASKTVTENKQTSLGRPERLPYGMTKIAFVRGDFVHLYDLSTKEVRRIAEGYDPDISPRGDAIIFTVNRDDSGSNTTIKLFRSDTNAITEFQALSKLNVRQARWSHNGSKLVFKVIVEGRSHIGILDTATGEWYDVTQGLSFNDPGGVYSASWSPDDGSILCHDLYTIYEISLNGNVLNRIAMDSVVPIGEVASSVRFQYSGDKKRLLFNGAWDPENTAIYLYSLVNRKLQKLTPETMDGSEPVWLPSGNEIMFSCRSDASAGTTTDLCVMSLVDRKVTTVIRDATSGSYSP